MRGGSDLPQPQPELANPLCVHPSALKLTRLTELPA